MAIRSALADDLAATIETIGGDVMTQMRLTAGGLDRQGGLGQCVVGTAHAALGRRGFSLWNSHDKLRMCIGRIVLIGGGQRKILDRKDLNGAAYNVTSSKTPDLNYVAIAHI